MELKRLVTFFVLFLRLSCLLFLPCKLKTSRLSVAWLNTVLILSASIFRCLLINILKKLLWTFIFTSYWQSLMNLWIFMKFLSFRFIMYTFSNKENVYIAKSIIFWLIIVCGSRNSRSSWARLSSSNIRFRFRESW